MKYLHFLTDGVYKIRGYLFLAVGLAILGDLDAQIINIPHDPPGPVKMKFVYTTKNLRDTVHMEESSIAQIKAGTVPLQVIIPIHFIKRGYTYKVLDHSFSRKDAHKGPINIDIPKEQLSNLDISKPDNEMSFPITRQKGVNGTVVTVGAINVGIKPSKQGQGEKNKTDTNDKETIITPSSCDTIFVTNCAIDLKTCDLNGVLTGGDVFIEEGIEFKKDREILRTGTRVSLGYVIHILKWADTHPFYLPRKKVNNLNKNKQYVYDASKTNFSGGMTTDHVRYGFPLQPTVPQYLRLDSANFACTDTAKQIVDKIKFTDFNIQSLPAKLRFGSDKTLHYPDDNSPYHRRFDVSSGINIGAAFGPRVSVDHGKGNYFMSFLGGFSVGTVNVDSSTTDNKCGSSKTSVALTPYLGITFEYQKFQLGVFSGIDFLTGVVGRNWAYRYQPWLGIGIGYSIFGSLNGGSTQGQ